MKELEGVTNKYYNSDLNEYIGKRLPNKMTAIDVDLILLKKWPPQKGFPILRICEYKHRNEQVGREQSFALKLFAKVFMFLNSVGYKDKHGTWRFGVYILRGDPPFDDGILCTDLIMNETKQLSKKEMDQFLLME